MTSLFCFPFSLCTIIEEDTYRKRGAGKKMTKEEILAILEEKQLTDVIELIQDAETGDLEELELVESLGLLWDETLNREVLQLLESMGVSIIYVTDDDEEGEEDEGAD
jgi:predicted house-cleaning noncanonical NTP pyrophosphatase (MazG superfamily)